MALCRSQTSVARHRSGRQAKVVVSRGALNPATDRRVIPARDWLGFYLLSPGSRTLARVDYMDFAGFVRAGSRWARAAHSCRLEQFDADGADCRPANPIVWQAVLLLSSKGPYPEVKYSTTTASNWRRKPPPTRSAEAFPARRTSTDGKQAPAIHFGMAANCISFVAASSWLRSTSSKSLTCDNFAVEARLVRFYCRKGVLSS